MRIIAGIYKGRPLAAPKGSNTRPTTDRVKESLISSLISAYGPLDDAYVLDAFAGSGALGIECLSRGAAGAHFFERDRNALQALQSNVSMLKLPATAARVFKADIMKNPPVYGVVKYNIVFLDPPYAYSADDVFSLVDALVKAGRLASDAIISYEHAAGFCMEDFISQHSLPYDVIASKKFGDTVIDLMTFAEIQQ